MSISTPSRSYEPGIGWCYDDSTPEAPAGALDSPDCGEDFSESGEEDGDGWDHPDPDYGDWMGEKGDFTKKLNAARRGQAGANPQQSSSRGQPAPNSSDLSQKSIHVSSDVTKPRTTSKCGHQDILDTFLSQCNRNTYSFFPEIRTPL